MNDMRQVEELEKLVNSLEIDINHVNNASLLAKPKQAEIAMTRMLLCFKKVIEVLENE